MNHFEREKRGLIGKVDDNMVDLKEQIQINHKEVMEQITGNIIRLKC